MRFGPVVSVDAKEKDGLSLGLFTGASLTLRTHYILNEDAITNLVGPVSVVNLFRRRHTVFFLQWSLCLGRAVPLRARGEDIEEGFPHIPSCSPDFSKGYISPTTLARLKLLSICENIFRSFLAEHHRRHDREGTGHNWECACINHPQAQNATDPELGV